MKIKAIIAVLSVSLAMLTATGCADSSDKIKETDSASTGDTLSGDETRETLGFARFPDNVEDYAIFKFKADAPTGFDTVGDDENGKCYVNGEARLTVVARNFKEDYQSLDIFAESACLTFSIQNMLYHSDTNFSDPVKTTVAGFDAVYYDYEIIAYEFVKDETATEAAVTTAAEGAETEATTTDPGVKTEIGRHKGRVVYFYSDEDVFYTMFQTEKENFDKNLPYFEEFLKSVSIEK